jgi:VanZ family protein
MTLTILWLLIILLFSIEPIGGPKTGFPIDKIVHFVVYGITAVLFFRVFMSRMSLSKSAVLSISLASMYGLAMELLQYTLPWRKFSLFDEVANIIGASLFGILYCLREYHRKKLNIVANPISGKGDV